MKKIISFVFITLLSISIFSQSIPVQKNKKQGRTETLKEISFMSFDYTSKRDDVISYFNKYGVEFKVINNWKSSGSLDYETYRIEDIEYCGCTFIILISIYNQKTGIFKPKINYLEFIVFL